MRATSAADYYGGRQEAASWGIDDDAANATVHRADVAKLKERREGGYTTAP